MLIGLQKNRVMTNWYEEIPLMIENLIKKEEKEDCPEKDRK
jgi:hypothetical protein